MTMLMALKSQRRWRASAPAGGEPTAPSASWHTLGEFAAVTDALDNRQEDAEQEAIVAHVLGGFFVGPARDLTSWV